MSDYSTRTRVPFRARRITPDELEQKAHDNPGAQIEMTDTDVLLTVAGVTYIAEFDIRTAVA